MKNENPKSSSFLNSNHNYIFSNSSIKVQKKFIFLEISPSFDSSCYGQQSTLSQLTPILKLRSHYPATTPFIVVGNSPTRIQGIGLNPVMNAKVNKIRQINVAHDLKLHEK